MSKGVISFLRVFDVTLFFAMSAILLAGLFTMSSFQGNDAYFWKQSIWIIISLSVFLVASQFEYRFLKQTRVVMWLYSGMLGILLLLFALGHISKGALSWFQVGGIAFQPSDLMKLVLIIVLAKYFSRRHVEIANMKQLSH
jgi:rod shape determining protein RodA